MEKEQITQLLEKQRQYFYSGATLNLDFRISALKRLRASIRKHEAQIHAALRKDLGKAISRAICVKPDWCSPRSHIC